MTGSDNEVSGDEKDEFEECENDIQKYWEAEQDQEEESEPEEPITEEEDVEEEEQEENKVENRPKIAPILYFVPHTLSSVGLSMVIQIRHRQMSETKVQVQEPSRMSGNPTVLDEVLEKILNNDPDTTEVNLNIDNISQSIGPYVQTNMYVYLALPTHTQTTSWFLPLPRC